MGSLVPPRAAARPARWCVWTEPNSPPCCVRHGQRQTRRRRPARRPTQAGAGLRREEVAQLAGLGVDYVIRLEQGRRQGRRRRCSVRWRGRCGCPTTTATRCSGSPAPRPAGRSRPDAGSAECAAAAGPDVGPARPRAVGEVRRARLEPARHRAVRRLLRGAGRTANLIRQRLLGTGIGRITLSPARTRPRTVSAACEPPGPLPGRPRPRPPHRRPALRQRPVRKPVASRPLRTAACRQHHRQHSELGPLTLDCDVLLVPEADQTVLVYSAEPGTSSASALELLRVTGLEQFTY